MVWIITIVIILLVLYVISTYNSLVGLKNKVKDGWSQIEVVLKRRADLIPNLVETVKGYTKHEEGTLTAVVEARNKAVSAKTPEEAMKADGEITQALSRLFENKITYSRQFYNDNVLNYNNKTEMFPSNIVASIFKFEKFKFFEASEQDRETPKVQF